MNEQDKAFEEIERLREEAMAFLDKSLETDDKEKRKEYTEKASELFDEYHEKIRTQLDKCKILLEQK